MGKKIYEKSIGYSIFFPIVKAVFKLAYRKIEIKGLENIPEGAPIIFSPNHTNALMDALAVLTMTDTPKVFVARMDLFKKPLIAKILNALKIMPIVRIRDGYENLKKNNVTIERAVEALCNNSPFVIFPEAAHNTQRTLLPLTKGIFRIALSAQHKIDKPLYIVPLGVDYGNYYRYRSKLFINIGKPINVQPYLQMCETEGEGIVMNKMKAECSQAMSDLILAVPRDENSDIISDMCAVRMEDRPKKLSVTLKKNQEIAKDILEYIHKDEVKGEELIKLGSEFRKTRLESKVSLLSVARKTSFGKILLNIITVIIMMPYTAVMAILFSPLELFTQHIVGLLKDPIFGNSLRFALNLFVRPLMMIAYAVICGFVFSWQWAGLFLLTMMPATAIVSDITRLARLVASDICLLRNEKLKEIVKKIRSVKLNE